MPRRYRMTARAEGVEATRQRIVEAAMAVHTERGVLATNWQDIAEKARVSQATVYRHFPSLEALVPACMRAAFEAGAQLPTPEQAAAIFAGVDDVGERLELLIRESCRCYERGAGWLDAARREARVAPSLARAIRTQDEGLQILLRAALAGRETDSEVLASIQALIDFPFWKSLVDAGVAPQRASRVIAGLVRSQVEAGGER